MLLDNHHHNLNILIYIRNSLIDNWSNLRSEEHDVQFEWFGDKVGQRPIFEDAFPIWMVLPSSRYHVFSKGQSLVLHIQFYTTHFKVNFSTLFPAKLTTLDGEFHRVKSISSRFELSSKLLLYLKPEFFWKFFTTKHVSNTIDIDCCEAIKPFMFFDTVFVCPWFCSWVVKFSSSVVFKFTSNNHDTALAIFIVENYNITDVVIICWSTNLFIFSLDTFPDICIVALFRFSSKVTGLSVISDFEIRSLFQAAVNRTLSPS